MDILHLVDRLEELFNESRPFPFTHSVIVNEDRILDIIDQMRVSIPEEIKKAQQLLAQRDRILAQAQEEANRTLALAREKSEQMIERDAIVDAARARAEQIVDEIHMENEKTKRDADEYVLQTLTGLEAELDRVLSQVRNGVRTLQSEKQTSLTAQNRAREVS
jgi:F0F1-type ATP synthase membrane subunit b/b'